MANSKGPDWEKTGTIVAMAEWLRSKSGAFAVVVIRRDDAALAIHRDIAPRDAQNLVEDRIGDLAVAADDVRRGKRKDARLELGPVCE
jgi:hypothetical protein